MAMSEHQFQQFPSTSLHPHQQSNGFSQVVYDVDPQPINYLNAPIFPDYSHHQPYIPPFQVGEVSDCGLGLRPKEQDFFAPSIVSTGLGLSIDNGRLASSGDSELLAILGGDIEQELHRQDADIDTYLRIQGDRMKQAIIEKVLANQLQTLTLLEENFGKKLREKETEVQKINKKNIELELQIEQVAAEASAWQQRAKSYEYYINTLNFNLQQAYAQAGVGDSKEGCGDSEIADSNKLMSCKICGLNDVSMVLLPCKHICACKECEVRVSVCPVCQSSKFSSMEVFMYK